MKIINNSILHRLLLAVALLTPALFTPVSDVEAAEFCSDQYYINETLQNGSSWDMCWEHRQREGIIFHHVFYKPKDGIRRMILNFAAVAQIHVPYDDNGARYHDISDYGIGGNNMLNLNADECPSGNLLQFGTKNVLCQQTYKEQFAYKSGNNTDSGNSLSLFSVSPVGAYYYISRWRFQDDGLIEPAIGATGALQRFGSNQSRGWPLSNNQTGIAHLHNFYWKLDFDLNNTGNDDVVEEINFALIDGKRQRSISTFNSEVSRKVNPTTLRHWRVRDKSLNNANGHGMSYDILINESGHQDIGPSSEPFTQNDFYVTKQRDTEKFASHNVTGGKNLAEFTNGESLLNGDIVVWPGTTFYHMPRNEDIPHMDAHWSHIKIVPRDWHASNPLVSALVNTPPTISSPSNQNTAQNTAVNLAIQANDIDGDSLSFSATGLPAGLQINTNSGLITGTANSAGNFSVTVNVSDGTVIKSTQFSWTVVAVNTNTPPTITNPNNQSGNTGVSVSLSIQANDSDNDTLTYTASNLPTGLAINSSIGLISGTPDTVGNNNVSITVSDATTSASTQFSWAITAPTGIFSNQVSNTAITINGSVNDWSGLDYYTNDPDDIDNSSGSNNQIDWLRASIAHSPQNVFINYQNRQNIDSSNTSGTFVPWGWTIYFDTDDNSATGYQGTGNIGADYIISGSVIERYTGTGSNWSWTVVDNATLSYSGSNLEMQFPRSLIGNPSEMRLVFVGSNAAFNGSDTDLYPDTGSFRYQFSGASNTNIAPVANNQQVSVGSGSSVSLVLSASDANNNSLNYRITQQPQNGSVTGSAPNIVYTANNNFVGTDTIRFKANDGLVDSQTATVTINVTSSQNADAFSNFVNSAIVIDGNNADWSGLDRFDADPNDASGNIDWQDVAFAHNNQMFYLNYANHGNIDPDNSSGTYMAWGWQVFIDIDKQANTGYQVGAIGADYLIEGNQLQKYTGTGSNWSWNSITAATTQYSGGIAELSLARSQLGNPDSIRVLFTGDSSSYAGSGTDLYPNGQNNSSAARQYFDYDFSGGSTGGNTRPIASTQNVNVNTGASVNITLSGSDSDNDSLSYNVLANPANGSLSGNAPNLSYTANSGFVGQDSFTFNVSDGSSISETASVNINVTSTQNGAYSNLVNSINVDGNDTDWTTLTPYASDSNDISGSNNFINWQSAATAHSANTLYFLYQNYSAVNPSSNSGNFVDWGWQTYIDTDGNNTTGYQIGNIGAEYIIEGTQLQTYTGSGSNWSWASFTPVNVKYSGNTVELSFARSLITNPSELRVLFVGNNAPSGGNSVDNYPDSLSSFIYQLSGGTVTSANRPVASAMTVAVSQNANRTFNLSASDQDNDTLSYRLISPPSNGNLSSFNTTGRSIVYAPDANFAGNDSFSYVVNDGTFDSSVMTVTLNVANGSSTDGNNNESDSGGGSFTLVSLIIFALFWFAKFINVSSNSWRRMSLALLMIVFFSIPFSTASAAEDCSDEFYINQTLPNGASWDMCWEHRQREGITLSAVYFTPKGGTRRMVLNHAAIAQIHVPYDDNGTRFHDVSDLGIGGQNLLNLNADECASGTIYPITYIYEEQTYTKNGFCKQVLKKDVGYKSGQNTAPEYYLNLFNVSPVGAYYYIPTWRFMDNGAIEPWMGATGALQRFSAEESRGWKLGDERIGIAHLHNFYWKLDFDLNKTHLDDVVEEVNFKLDGAKRSRQTTVFNTEASRKVNPSTMRHWRVSDKNTRNTNGHNISYDILLNETGHQDIGPASEPFTENDFYVTKQKDQEKFASHNTSGAKNLAEFTNGEVITDNDIVVWAGITFYHMPRSEDDPHMDAHWSHLKIIPRDLSEKNTLIDSNLNNTAPEVSNIPKQSTKIGFAVSINVTASDVDGDSLSYSASGLPSGITIDSNSGQILGVPNQIGEFQVEVNTNDGQDNSSIQFAWTITSDGINGENSSDSGGSINLITLLFFMLIAVLKNRFRFKKYV